MKKKNRIFKLLCIVAVCLVLFFGCVYIYHEYIVNQTEEVEIIEVACVGDSLTFRRSYTEDFYNYPEFLDELLGENYKVTNYGVAGTCLQEDASYPYSSTRAYKVSLEADADVVVIMLGTNDIWFDRWHGEEAFYQYYTKLIDSYLKVDDAPEIYLCTIPYIFLEENPEENIDYNGIGAQINSVIMQIAEDKGYHLIEIHEISKEHSEWYEEDGVHLSYEGAAGVAEVVYNALN